MKPQRLISVIILMLCCMLSFSQTPQEQLEGDGTEENPYRINNFDDFLLAGTIWRNYNTGFGKFYKLYTDIYIPASIREDYLENHVHFIFGTLDGNGHSISIEDYTDEEISRLYHYYTTLLTLDPKPILAKKSNRRVRSNSHRDEGGIIKNLNFISTYTFPFCLFSTEAPMAVESADEAFYDYPYYIYMENVNNYANFNFPEDISIMEFGPLFVDDTQTSPIITNCNNYGNIVAILILLNALALALARICMTLAIIMGILQTFTVGLEFHQTDSVSITATITGTYTVEDLAFSM